MEVIYNLQHFDWQIQIFEKPVVVRLQANLLQKYRYIQNHPGLSP